LLLLLLLLLLSRDGGLITHLHDGTYLGQS
jgi:hypothetical protein